MSGFLLWGVIAGAALVAIHLYFSASARQTPVLSEAVELIVWSIGVTGGIKVCKYVLTGELSAAFKTTTPIAEEDLVYFLVGGFTLIWISFDSILRRLWGDYRLYRIQRTAAASESPEEP